MQGGVERRYTNERLSGQAFMLDTHYPCPQAMSTGRGHGRGHKCQKMTPVSTSRVGHQRIPRYTLPVVVCSKL